MIDPNDRAKPCTLSLEEIEKRLTPEQRKALKQIWRGIKKSKLPIRSYLDMNEWFEEMIIDRARELFEVQPHEQVCARVASAYAGLAWLDAKVRREGLERKPR